MKRAVKAVGALAAALCLTAAPACLRTKAVKYYTLAGEGALGPPRASAVRYTVRVAAVSVPEMLDRPELVLRVSATELTIDESHQWAEPLRAAIARAVADNLAHELDGALVSTADSEAVHGPTDVQVSIDVRHLDLGLADGASIDVAWVARWTDNGPIRKGRSVQNVRSAPPIGYDAVVIACAAALEAVSRDVAQSVRADYLSRK